MNFIPKSGENCLRLICSATYRNKVSRSGEEIFVEETYRNSPCYEKERVLCSQLGLFQVTLIALRNQLDAFQASEHIHPLSPGAPK